MSFTFIFITKGKRIFDINLSNCLNLSLKHEFIKTIVIDGNDDDRVDIFLEQISKIKS